MRTSIKYNFDNYKRFRNKTLMTGSRLNKAEEQLG